MNIKGITRILPSNVVIDYSLFNYGYGTTIEQTQLMYYIDGYNDTRFSIDMQTTIDGDYVYLVEMSYTIISGYLENDTFFLTKSMLTTIPLLCITSSEEFRCRPENIILLYHNNDLYLTIQDVSMLCNGIYFIKTNLHIGDVLSIMKEQKFLEIHY